MSGGFFRGTSADQDTRFSNKQAKLMKSQKFAPELEHLVDMSKVKMDVVRPWIATRVTELLGFEDEVLINFIYGLLEGKDINGKEVQIHLTGFMEKNTGKFMKELWTLLLSAQKNASGVPQQFLDAKEEETRKKKAEADRITSEIQRKKEKEVREHEEDKIRKMDGGAGFSKTTNAALELTSKFSTPRDSSVRPEDEIEGEERNGLRGRKRVSRSPHPADHSPPSRRGTPSKSISKSFSNSRSYSQERHKSRSVSKSPQPRGRSISSGRVHASLQRRSLTPHARGASPQVSLSPTARRSSYLRRRSISRSPRRRPHSPVHNRMHSPVRRRLSPDRRRSRSPIRRRSPSPRRRRSPPPIRRRSPSPTQYSSPSPVRRRSPSPMRRRRRRSPSTPRRRSPPPHRRRSPPPHRRRSPPPPRRRSPPPPRRRSPSPPLPHRSPSPLRRRSPIPDRRRSPVASRRRPPSPSGSSSPSPFRCRSLSPGRRTPKNLGRSPLQSPRERKRSNEKLSPVRHASQREKVEHAPESGKGPDFSSHRHSISLRSPQRDLKDRNDSRKKVPALSPSPDRSPIVSESPPTTRKRNRSVDQRLSSPYGEGLVRQTREVPDESPRPSRKPRDQKASYESLRPSGEEKAHHAREERDPKPDSIQKKSSYSTTVKHKDSPVKVHQKGEYFPERLGGQHRATNMEPRKKDQDIAGKAHRDDNMDLRKKDQATLSDMASRRVAPHEVFAQQKSPTSHKDSLLSERQQREEYKADEKNELRPSGVKVHRSKRKDNHDSSSEENDGQRKHKRSHKKEVSTDDDYSHDSQAEERKQTKKRKKEEKRLRKEERRRRREERRRRREERRADKLKLKSNDAVTPPSDNDAYSSDAENEHGTKETESEQKKLEIELREKALESLRAKKGISS